MSSRPVIGITGESARVRAFPPDEAAIYGIPRAYVDAMAALDACAVVIPPINGNAAVVDRLDGVIFSGGDDIDPARYHAPSVRPQTVLTDRDDPELSVLQRALELDLPVLGICRGMQLLAVRFGGSLHQHLPEVLGHDIHAPGGSAGRHGVRFEAGSLMSNIHGAECSVTSFHHQGVADAGSLTATGWAEDGLIEAVEHPDCRLVVGVQWHPERSPVDGSIFEPFVQAARRSART